MAVDITVRLINQVSGEARQIRGDILGMGNDASMASKGFSTMGSAVKVAGVAAAAGVAIAGAAMVKTAVDGVKAFGDFQDSMNEIFTLLPNISAEAMGQMSDDVLALSVDIGRLPNEVMPALYQSLSAGVPQDNVFDFMATAHEAALGGVTSLETAVDGITSVMNAYGADVLDATQASDLMFTAVRLGKTTFGELSQSLSNITPLASGMGVAFGDVTAAMATMTSQGTPTAVATTQMRALLQELGTAGTVVADVFTQIAGESFLDFTAEGGNVAEALQMLEQYSTEAGVPIQDLFGNVRGGMAALQLTGSGMESFVNNLEEMENSAGATNAAYETMNAGMKRTFEQIQAQGAAFMIQIGEALAPAVNVLSAAVFEFVDDAGPKLIAIFENIVTSVGNMIAEFQKGFERGGNAFYGLMEVLDNFIMEDELWEMADAVLGVVDAISNAIAPVLEFVNSFVSWQDVLIVVGAIIAGTVIPALISLASAIIGFLAPVIVTFGAMVAAVALVRTAWERDFGGIRTFVLSVVDALKGTFETFFGYLENGHGIVVAIQAAVSRFMSNMGASGPEINNVSRAIGTFFENLRLVMGVISNLKGSFETFFGYLKNGHGIVVAIQAAVSRFMSNMGASGPEINNISRTIGVFFENIKNAGALLSGFFGPTIARIGEAFAGLGQSLAPVLPKLKVLFDALKNLMVALKPVAAFIGAVLAVAFKLLGEVIASVMRNAGAILGTVIDYISSQLNALATVINGIVTFVKGVFAGDWEAAWQGITQVFSGVLAGIKGTVTAVIGLLGSFARIIFDSFANLIGADISFDELKQTIVDTFVNIYETITGKIEEIKTALLDFVTSVQTSWENFKETIIGIWEAVGTKIDETKTTFLDFAMSIETSWENFKETIVGIWETITTTITEKVNELKAAWDNLVASGDAVKTGVSGIGEAFTEFFTKLAAFDLAGLISGWLTTFETWATGLIANAIIWGVGIVQSFISALIAAPGQIATALTNWYTTFVTWFSSIDWEQVGYDIADYVITGLEFFTQTIPDTIGNWITSITGAIVKAATEFYNAGVEIVTNIVTGLVDFATLAAAEIATWPTKIKGWIVSTAQTLIDVGTEIVTNIVTGLTDFVTLAAAEIATWPTKISDWITSTAQSLIATGTEIVTNIVTGLTDFVTLAAAEIATWPAKILGWITNAATELYNAGVAIVTNIVNGLVTFATNAWEEIKTWPGEILSYITTLAAELITAGVEIVISIVEGLLEFNDRVWGEISTWPGIITQYIADVADSLIAAGTAIVTNIITGVSEFATEVVTVVASWPGAISDKVSEMADQFFFIGSDIINGIIGGLKDGLGRVLEIISSLTSGINRRIEEDEDMGSPSLVWWEYGMFLVQGLANGIRENAATAVNAAGELIGEIDLEVVKKMAEAIKAVADSIGPAIAALTAIGKFNIPRGVLDNVEELLFQIHWLVRGFAYQAYTLSSGSMKAANNLVDTIINIADSIGIIVDVLHEIERARIPTGLDKKFEALAYEANSLALLFGVASTTMEQETYPQIEAYIGALTAILDSVQKIIEVSLLIGKTDFSETLGEGYHFHENVVTLRNLTRDVMREFGEAANEITNNEAILAYVNALTALYAVVQSAIDTSLLISQTDFSETLGAGYHFHDNMVILRNLTRDVMREFAEAASEIKSEQSASVQAYIEALTALYSGVQLAIDTSLLISLTDFSETLGEGYHFHENVVTLRNLTRDFMREFGEAANEFSTTGLQHIQAFVDATTALFNLIGLAISAFTEINKYVPMEEAWVKIGEFNDDLKMTVGIIGLGLTVFMRDGGVALGQAAEAAALVQTLLSMITTAVEALTAIGEYVPIIDAMNAVQTFKDDLFSVIIILGTALWIFVQDGGEALTAAAQASVLISDLLSVIGPAVEALAAINEYTKIKDVNYQIAAFAIDLLSIAPLLIAALNSLNDGLDGTLVLAAEASSSVTAVLDVISPAIASLTDLANYVGLPNATVVISSLKDDLEIVARELIAALSELANGLGESLTIAGEAAGSVSAILGVVKPAIDALIALAEYKAVEYLVPRMSVFTWQFRTAVDLMVKALEWLYDNLGDSIQVAQTVAESMSAIFSSITSGADALQKLADAKIANAQPKLDELIEQTNIIATTFSSAAMNVDTDVLQNASNFATSMNTLVDYVSTAIGHIEALVGGDFPGGLQKIMNDMIMTMENQIEPSGLTGLEIGAAFGEGLDASMLDTIANLGDTMDELVAIMRASIPDARKAGADFGAAFVGGLSDNEMAAARAMVQVAQSAADGFVNAMNARAPSMAQSVSNAMQQAIDAARYQLQAFSPSHAFEKLAEESIEGYERPWANPGTLVSSVQGGMSNMISDVAGTSASSTTISGDTIVFQITLDSGSPVPIETERQLEGMIQRVLDRNGRRGEILRRTGR
jgi:TP901 family phage tail tape measure protein